MTAGRARRRLVAVALAWSAIGVSWAAAVGRYGWPGEPAHVLRAYAVAHGDVEGDTAPGLPSGYRAVTVPRSLGTGDPTCYRHDPTVPSTCSVPDPATIGDPSDDVVVATSAGVAPPLYYALVGVPARLVVFDDPLAYRLVALAWVVAALTVAVARARPLGRSALVMLVLVPPSAWFMLGVVNPNSLEIALAALAWVGAARSRREGVASAVDLLWIALPLSIAVAMRPIALVPAIAVMAVLLVDRRTRPGWRGAVLLALPTAVAGVGVLAWQQIIRWDGTDPRTAVAVSLWRALRDSVGGLGRTAGELVGTSGWLELSLPVPVKVAWLALVAAVLVSARSAGERTGGSAWRPVAVWAAVLVGTPVMFETAYSSSIGPIWQGRYSLPVFIGLGALAAVVARPGRWLQVALIGASAVEMAAFVVSVRRYAVGVDGSWWLRHADHTSRWLSPRGWVVVHLAVMIVIAAWQWRAAAGPPEPSSEHVAEHVDDDVGVAGVVEHGQLPG